MKPLYILGIFTLAACQGASADPSTQVLEQGPELYGQYCESCHGVNLSGGLAPSLADQNWEFGGEDKDLIKIINRGNDEVGMPAFGDQLNVEEVQNIISYIRSGGGENKTIVPIDDVPSVQDRVQINDWVVGLNEPWGIHFIGADRALVTEKSGKLWLVSSKSKVEIKDIPSSDDQRQGGLMDVATDPDYAENGWVYLSFTHADERNPENRMTKIVRGKIIGNNWGSTETLFQAKPEHYLDTGFHFGSRITFDNQGHLYFGIGDRGKKEMAQDLSKPNGKIHRIMRDGSIPKDNPFVGKAEAYASIFAYGNRNPQGTIVHPESQVVWETEHGPKGGDELNVIRSGVNYGWPEISYGRNYSGTVLTPYTGLPGMAQPASQWTPSIAVCGLDVYTGDLFPEWKGRLMAGSLKNQTVRLIDVNEESYAGEAILIKDQGRVRDVTTGSDGAIYVALPDKIVRLSPL